MHGSQPPKLYREKMVRLLVQGVISKRLVAKGFARLPEVLHQYREEYLKILLPVKPLVSDGEARRGIEP